MLIAALLLHTYVCTNPVVVDGDTVKCHLELGLNVSVDSPVRLYGIDTPELHSSNKDERARAFAAKARTESLLKDCNDVTVETSKEERDKFGRVLGSIIACKKDVRAILLQENLGKPYFGGAR